MKRNVLFIPATIKSHLIPTLDFAHLLSSRFNVFFSVSTNDLEEIIVKNDFVCVRTDSFRVANAMEKSYLTRMGKPSGKISVLKCIVKNSIFYHRQTELEKVMNFVTPDAVYIDIYNSMDFLVLYSKYKDIRYFLVNPMLSTFRKSGYPGLSQGVWPEPERKVAEKNQIVERVAAVVRDPIEWLFRTALRYQFKKITLLSKAGERHPVARDTTSALLFEGLPEFILAPEELEFSTELRRQSQHYLGLGVREDRWEPVYDAIFDEKFELIKQRQREGARILYCSFGSFYNGSDNILIDFLNRFIRGIVGIENMEAIISVNSRVIDLLKLGTPIANNIHLFDRVPQLSVLKHADLFVTHGGLSSIKEGIYFGVPLLVYPLDLNYDQNGNAFKVEYHGLGMRGIMRSELADDIRAKAQILLDDPTCKGRLSTFSETINQRYSREEIWRKLNDLHNTWVLD